MQVVIIGGGDVKNIMRWAVDNLKQLRDLVIGHLVANTCSGGER